MPDNPGTVACRECFADAEEVPDSEALYKCPSCGGETELIIRRHTRNMWKERRYGRIEYGTELPRAIKRAWTGGRTLVADYRDWEQREQIPHVSKTYGHRFYCDEARFYRPEKIILVRRADAIVTAIDVPTARINARWTVLQTHLVDGASPNRIKQLQTETDVDDSHISGIIDREKTRRRIARASITNTDDGQSDAPVVLDSVPPSWPEARIDDPDKITI